MDKAEITTLQQQSVAQITEKLPALDREALVELLAQETASAAPRTTLVTAIDKQLVALDESDAGEAGATDKAAPAAARVAEKIPLTDWRHEHYAGPLNGEQAAWRVRNLKPAAKVSTK